MKTLLVGFLLCGMAWARGKPRIFVATADPSSSSAVTVSSYFGPSHGEQVRTLGQACSGIVITEDASKADFVLRWESKTWQQTSWKGHQQEFTLYSREKDVLATGATHNIKNAAKDICKLIEKQASPQPTSH